MTKAKKIQNKVNKTGMTVAGHMYEGLASSNIVDNFGDTLVVRGAGEEAEKTLVIMFGLYTRHIRFIVCMCARASVCDLPPLLFL